MSSKLSPTQMMAALSLSSEAIIVLDEHGIILYVNPAFEKTFKLSQGETAGKPLDRVKIRDLGLSLGEFIERKKEEVGDSKIWQGELNLSKNDRGSLFADVAVYYLTDEKSTIVALRNCTEEVILRKYLNAGNIVEMMYKILQHMTSELSVVSLLLEGIKGNDSANDNAILQAGSTCRRIAEMAKSLEALGRKNQGNQKNVNIYQTISGMAPSGFFNGMFLNLECPDRTIKISADPEQFRRALLGIIFWATGSSSEAVNPQITIRVGLVKLNQPTRDEGIDADLNCVGARPGKYVTIEFIGPLCGPSKISGNNSLEYELACAFIAQVGGWVDTSRSGLSDETILKIFLPAKGVTTREILRISENPGGGENILLVANNSSLGPPAVKALESSGYVVSAAYGYQDGYDCLATNEDGFDLVILELSGSPPLNMEILKNVRDAARPHSKLIVIADFCHDEISQIIGEGSFLEKPFTTDQLLLQVRAVLDRQ